MGIISYSKFNKHGASKTTRNGFVMRLEQAIEIHDIMTDTGEMYEISYYGALVYEEEPSQQGIHSLTIKRVNQIFD